MGLAQTSHAVRRIRMTCGTFSIFKKNYWMLHHPRRAAHADVTIPGGESYSAGASITADAVPTHLMPALIPPQSAPRLQHLLAAPPPSSRTAAETSGRRPWQPVRHHRRDGLTTSLITPPTRALWQWPIPRATASQTAGGRLSQPRCHLRCSRGGDPPRIAAETARRRLWHPCRRRRCGSG